MYNDHIVKHREPNNTLGYTQKDLFLVITIIFGTLLIYTTYRILLPWKKIYSIFCGLMEKIQDYDHNTLQFFTGS